MRSVMHFSHGLYAGVSLEACGIAQCKSVNRAFYGERAHASSLLAGDHGKPYGAEPLYKALDLLSYDGKPPADLEANRYIQYERSKTKRSIENTDSQASPTPTQSSQQASASVPSTAADTPTGDGNQG